MIPAHRGEIDELLEPVESRPERTMPPTSVGEGMPQQPSLQQTPSTKPGASHNRTQQRPTIKRAPATPAAPDNQQQHLDTTPLLQECRSARPRLPRLLTNC